jgi:hypothetical protein
VSIEQREEREKKTNRSASSITRTSRLFVSPTPTPLDCCFIDPFFVFLFSATLLLPSKNSSNLPGVPTRISAPFSKNAFLSSCSELPPMRS